MRGSYLAQIVDEEIKREKRLKEIAFRKKCKTCKNKETDLCSIVEGIDGKLRCINYEAE